MARGLEDNDGSLLASLEAQPGKAAPVADKVDYSEDDDDFEIDEAYFMRTYRPLSNLPTPPPSSRNSAATQSPRSLLEDGETLQARYLGMGPPLPFADAPRPFPLALVLHASREPPRVGDSR